MNRSRWAGVALAVVALAALPADSSAGRGRARGRKGRVVRVERTTVRSQQRVRIFYMTDMNGVPQAMAYGEAPENGGAVTMVTDQGVVARATIATWQDSGQACGNMWSGTASSIEWVNAKPTTYWYGGIQGLDLEDSAKLVTNTVSVALPSGAVGSIWLAIDRDADGEADLIATSYPCADSEPPKPDGSPGVPNCIDVHALDRSERASPWRRIGHDVYYSCL